jgi:hypothetical protein
VAISTCPTEPSAPINPMGSYSSVCIVEKDKSGPWAGLASVRTGVVRSEQTESPLSPRYTLGPMLPPMDATTQGGAAVSVAGPVSPASSMNVPGAAGPAGLVDASTTFISSFPPWQGPPCPVVESSARTT